MDNICWDAAFKKKNRSILCQNTVMLLNLLKARTHVVHPQGHVSVKELPNVSIVLTLLLQSGLKTFRVRFIRILSHPFS